MHAGACPAGLFSVALVVTFEISNLKFEISQCPVVIRLAALWSSDFPLSRYIDIGKATARHAQLLGYHIIAKSC